MADLGKMKELLLIQTAAIEELERETAIARTAAATKTEEVGGRKEGGKEAAGTTRDTVSPKKFIEEEIREIMSTLQHIEKRVSALELARSLEEPIDPRDLREHSNDDTVPVRPILIVNGRRVARPLSDWLD